MIQKSRTWEGLKALQSFYMTKNMLSDDAFDKVLDTARYSLRKDESQDKTEVLQRCMIAMMAEQYIAEWTDGWVSGGNEDHDNPYSFAFDVMSEEGVRIEVKTHQSDSKWIGVTTGYNGPYPHGYGINLGPFLDHRIADLIIILDVVEEVPGRFLFTPKMMAGPQAFRTDTGLVKKSNYENGGYYLLTCNPENYPFHQFTSQ